MEMQTILKLSLKKNKKQIASCIFLYVDERKYSHDLNGYKTAVETKYGTPVNLRPNGVKR